ncbi:hypothetical protein AURDEDRAFT_161216 [Auricularia subglabra TFB-10046 SS5]|nr:hypothetical protein AURDEDRAFT_161216 [Auricularia subglabra TFB-10046 SS5]
MFAPAVVLLGLLSRSGRAQETTAVCSTADWTTNSRDEPPCKVWAQLQDICVPGTRVGRATASSLYRPIGIWVDEDRWAAGCSSYNSTGPPESVIGQLGNIELPNWATTPVRDGVWDPYAAENIAHLGGSATLHGTGSATKTAIPTNACGVLCAEVTPKKRFATILGSVVEVILGLSLIGLTIWLIRHYKRRPTYDRKPALGVGASAVYPPMAGPPPVQHHHQLYAEPAVLHPSDTADGSQGTQSGVPGSPPPTYAALGEQVVQPPRK